MKSETRIYFVTIIQYILQLQLKNKLKILDAAFDAATLIINMKNGLRSKLRKFPFLKDKGRFLEVTVIRSKDKTS